jgi:hypothetical protein
VNELTFMKHNILLTSHCLTPTHVGYAEVFKGLTVSERVSMFLWATVCAFFLFADSSLVINNVNGFAGGFVFPSTALEFALCMLSLLLQVIILLGMTGFAVKKTNYACSSRPAQSCSEICFK